MPQVLHPPAAAAAVVDTAAAVVKVVGLAAATLLRLPVAAFAAVGLRVVDSAVVR